MAVNVKTSKHDQRITEKTIKNIEKYIGASKTLILERISFLKKEWDIQKTFNFIIFGLISIFSLLGFLTTNIWFFLSLVISFISVVDNLLKLRIGAYFLRQFDFRTLKEIYDEILILYVMINDGNEVKCSDVLALFEALKKDDF